MQRPPLRGGTWKFKASLYELPFQDSHGSEAEASDEAIAGVDHGEGGGEGGGKETRAELLYIIFRYYSWNKSCPDLATIAPDMQTALGPNLLTSLPTMGPLKE